MSILYITEFATFTLVGAPGGAGQIAEQPEIANQAITIGASSAQSAAFNSKTRFVRLHTDVICAIEFGTNPTAVAAGGTGTARMPANQTEYFGVPQGQSYKVAVITST